MNNKTRKKFLIFAYIFCGIFSTWYILSLFNLAPSSSEFGPIYLICGAISTICFLFILFHKFIFKEKNI